MIWLGINGFPNVFMIEEEFVPMYSWKVRRVLLGYNKSSSKGLLKTDTSLLEHEVTPDLDYSSILQVL